MVFDAKRVLSNKVVGEGPHYALRGLGVAPAGGLANPADPVVGVDAHDVVGALRAAIQPFRIFIFWLRWYCGRSAVPELV